MTADAARAAQARQRLRDDAWMLKGAVQQSLRPATARKERAETAAAAARRRNTVLVAGAWSELEWAREDDALGRVLIPLD
jgi:hypothetical protein